MNIINFFQLENTPHASYLNTLNVFAYGTYRQYLENKSILIELTDVMKKKLKYLTIVTMAISDKCIAYSNLLEQLDIGCVRELEDLIIESIYAGEFDVMALFDLMSTINFLIHMFFCMNQTSFMGNWTRKINN